MSAFGEQLRRLRERAGLSQEALAERAGLTAKGIGALERGLRRHPYPQTVRVLADALNLGDNERAALLATIPRRGGQTAPLAPPRPAPERAVGAGSAVPGYLTEFIGRETETRVLLTLLARPEVRLLTLTGPGGVGKTHLAAHVADRARDAFPDGVVFVPLAPLRDPLLVRGAIARAVGLQDGDATTPEGLAAALAGRRLLLALDNLEQVVESGADLPALLLRCPELKVLVTSRAALRVRGEHEYRVPPLEAPAAGREIGPADLYAFPATHLFVARARSSAPGQALAPATVAAICRRLDGLPLAIELAAARLPLFPPPVLLARLERGMGILANGARDLPARQRTMRDTIAWSYDLLGDDERRLFRRLAAFDGGWTVEAAEAICAEPGAEGELLDGLGALLDQSMIRHDAAGGDTRAGDDPDGARLTMLETIREFAAEQLARAGEEEATRRRHASYYAGLLAGAATRLQGPGQVALLNQIATEHDNLRAALDWAARRGDAEAGLRLINELWRFWSARGHHEEGRRRLATFLALADEATPPTLRIDGLLIDGYLAYRHGDYPAARPPLEEALARARALGEREREADALLRLGHVAVAEEAPAEAERLYEETLALRRSLPDAVNLGIALGSLGRLCLLQGQRARGVALLEESLGLFRAAGDMVDVSTTLALLGRAALDAGEAEVARAYLTESLAGAVAIGDRQRAAICVVGLATVASTGGDAALGRWLANAVAAAQASEGLRLPDDWRARLDGVVAQADAAAQTADPARGTPTLDAAVAALLAGEPLPS